MLAFFLPERWPLSRQFDWPFSPEYPHRAVGSAESVLFAFFSIDNQ